ncbi:RHS repeat-associated core domain-containing protein [Marivirga sp.]|uniref:RHS repeat protein n=1 Tax=Marivirga sp. TaxID=2018662 RepID=UPI003DA78E5A
MVLQADDYYPFGLTFNSYKREFSKKNKMNTFQDQEYDEETGWVQFKWRNHQPELGRFFNVDPLAEDYYYNSPYAFSENQVVAHVELEGMEKAYRDPATGTIVPASDNIRQDTPEGAIFNKGGNPDDYEAASDALIEALFFFTPIDEAATVVNGEQVDGGEITSLDYVDAAVSLIIPKKGKGSSSKTYQTYTKTNSKTGEVYTGRTSGTKTPRENVANRDKSHHMKNEGFGRAKLDKSSTNKSAIRGREQQLIEKNGGAKSQGGTSGNKINGISPKNSKGKQYREAAKDEFGN